MTTRPFTLLATAILVAVLAGSALAAPDSDRYEMHVGKKKVDVVVGEPFRITATGGVHLDAVLRRPARVWPGPVLRFRYPREFRVDTNEPKGFLGWNVRRFGHEEIVVRMLAWAPGRSDPAKALAGAARTLKGKLGTGATEEPVQREVAGETRKGVRLTAMIGDDPQREDVFALRIGDRVLVISFRWRESTRARDEVAHTMVAGTLTPVEEAKEAEATPEFELHVGKRVYRIDVGKAFDLETGEGKTQSAVLRLGNRTFRAHGLTFRHPGDMSARLVDKPGRAMIHVERGLAYFASLQYFLVGAVEPEMAQALSLKFVKSSVEKTGAKFGRDRSCRFRIFGKSRGGTRMTTVGEDDPTIIEIYTLVVGGKVLSVLFHCRKSNKEQARAAFKMIASTLKKE